MGLYGVGGVGKTTLSKVIYNNMRQKFYGKACYIEFSSMNGIELQKKVLQRLTDIDPLILSNINEVCFNSIYFNIVYFMHLLEI